MTTTEVEISRTTRNLTLLLALFATGIDSGNAQEEPTTEAAQRTVVLLEGDAAIGGWDILLGDLATIEGPDPELVGRLLGESLGSAPAPSRSTRLTRDQIAQILIERGYMGKQIRLLGAPQVQITTEAKIISAESVRRDGVKLIESWFTRSFDDSNLPEVEVVVEPTGDLKDFVTPRGRRASEVIVRGNPREMTDRDARLTAHVVVDGRTVDKVALRFDIRRFRRTLVTRRPIRRGEEFDARRMEMRRVEVTTVTDPLVLSADELRGAVAARNIPALLPITRSDLLFPALVEKGEVVSVLLKNGPLTITTKAKARSSGRLGETVPLDNLASGKVIYALVVADGVVEIDLRPEPPVTRPERRTP